jgi:hypothetical protein
MSHTLSKAKAVVSSLKASGINCNTSLVSIVGTVLRLRYFILNTSFALPILSNPSVNEDVMAITCSMITMLEGNKTSEEGRSISKLKS